MNITATIIIISLAVVIFLIWNHFKRQEINFRLFIPATVLAAVFIIFTIKHPTFKGDATGLVLRFLLGSAIGILQGCISKVFRSDGNIFSVGTKVGLAFWLIFIPVRLFILPWFSRITPGSHNLEAPSLSGISALCIFTGFFLFKGITLFIRKVKLA